MIFFIFFSSILFLVYSYVAWKFIWLLNFRALLKTIFTLIIVIFYILTIFSFIFYFNKIENELTYIITWIGYIGLGLISLLFFIHIAIDLILIINNIFIDKNKFDPKRRAFIQLSLKGVAGILGLMGTSWGLYTATKTPIIKKIKIPIKNLPKSLSKIRMVQITDLHVSTLITNTFVEKVVKKIIDIEPDILFFTGDAADGSVQSFGKYLDPLMRIKPKYGKYFVTGNHEYYSDMNGWLNHIESLGFKILINESQNIIIDDSTIMLTGIPDRTGKYFSNFHKTDMKKALNGMPNSDLKILLAHQPKDIEYATKYNFDIQFSGHTHGGQYFPFSILVQMANPYLKGLHKKDNTWIYINQGTGYWGPPMRIGTEPEITEITLIS